MDEMQESEKADVRKSDNGVDVKSNESILTKKQEDPVSGGSVIVDKVESVVLVKMDEDAQSFPDIAINTESAGGSVANLNFTPESILESKPKEDTTINTDGSTSAVQMDEDLQSSSNAVESNVSSENTGNSETESAAASILLMDEHDYASTRRDNLEESNSLSNIDSIPSNVLSSPGQSTLENVMYSDDSSFVKEEIILSEEIIIESNEYNAYVNKQNIKNTNLSNELASHDMTREMFYIDKQTSLAAIAAQYDSSDSENEDDQNAGDLINNKDYRNKEIVLSSDDTSDSESDSSSSSDSDDSDAKSSQKSKKSEASGDESDDAAESKNAKNKQKKFMKPKSEFDDLPPIEDLTISVPEVLCDPLGEVAWTVEQMVVVRPKLGKPTLNLDTVLFIDKGQRALGHIFDVFGQVAEPHYCVRFNSSEHIQEKDIKVGMTVYYCPNTPYTSLVFLSELTKMKAADDIGDDEAPQFSDDEEEQAYLASLKKKQSEGANKPKEGSSETPIKRKRGNNTGWQSNHPWNSNREHQSHPHAQNPRPFYRSQHPWSRPRYQQPNPWHQYNSYPRNQWMPPPPHSHPSYNQMQAYNYLNPGQVPPMEMQNVGFSQVQWNPQYQLPQVNAAQFSGFPPQLVPPINLPPPPPPPPPPSSNAET